MYLDKWNVYGVARYAEVHAVLNDPATFCSSRGVGLSDFAKEKPWRPPSLILEADPPAHTRTRAVLSSVLSPAVMKRLRQGFIAAAEAKVDELLQRGSFDAVADLAEAYPLSVFPDAVGLRQEGREHLLPYAGVVFNAFGPPNELRQAADRALGAASGLCRRAVPARESRARRLRRLHPRLRRTGDITEAEAPLLVRSLLSAGLDTTVNGIGAAHLLPGALSRLNWRGCAPIRRWPATRSKRPCGSRARCRPFSGRRRAQVEIGGYRIGEGEKILMFLAAANRDPRRWSEPDSYDITRKTSGHVGFGSGIHMCVGQLVARLEGEVVLAAFARKVARSRSRGR